MKTDPPLSVVMPVFNARRHLRQAMDSILAQTFRDFEVVAVDDGSTDGSREILERYARDDSRVRVVSRPNTGIVGALNDAIAAARGEFLARMDADDCCAPARFERQLAHLRQHPDCVCVGSAVIFMDEDGAAVKLLDRKLDHEAIEAALLGADGGALIHPAVMLRAAAVAQVGGYRRETQYVEDVDLFLRLARIGRLANLTDPLLRYRVHPGSINFTRNTGRCEVLERVIAEAHAARGLPYIAHSATNPDAFAGGIAALHREWAATSLHFGTRRVAVRHALAACRLEPFCAASWSALRYALGAPLGAGDPPHVAAIRS